MLRSPGARSNAAPDVLKARAVSPERLDCDADHFLVLNREADWAAAVVDWMRRHGDG